MLHILFHRKVGERMRDDEDTNLRNAINWKSNNANQKSSSGYDIENDVSIEIIEKGRNKKGKKWGEDSFQVPWVIWEPKKEMKGKVD